MKSLAANGRFGMTISPSRELALCLFVALTVSAGEARIRRLSGGFGKRMLFGSSSGALLRLTPSRPSVAIPACAKRETTECPNSAIFQSTSVDLVRHIIM
jgi:hypothetical protein